ncbi:MAG TPA: hypothetical protein VFC67_12915 [Prolixibacteraceae bacterium]|nr:hypothetical protein [Prolixibacteraceae bacterium]
MHKISWTLFALLALNLSGWTQSDVSKARVKSNEIVVDGNDREWTKPLNFYDDKSGLLFAICNDKKNLYFAFTVNDEMKMRRLMSSGWSLEISSKEKGRKFNATLNFPGVNMTGMQRRPGAQFEKKVAGNPLIDSYRLQLQSVAVKGFQSNKSTLQLNDHNGIDIAIGVGSTPYIIYEMAIPFTELMASHLTQLDELITLSVSVNAFARPAVGSGDREGHDRRGGGGSRGEMSGMGGGRGGMGGGRQGGMSRSSGGYSGERSSSFEKISFKQKFTLTKE